MAILEALLFLLGLVLAWFTNILGLPGNWFMVAGAVGYWALMPADTPASIGTTTLVILGCLAIAGELLELMASSVGVKKAGGSRQSALYAILGSIAGGITGFVVGFPIPVIGPLIGSLFFGSLGAMAGAMLSEMSGGRTLDETMRIGKAAFWGRALGTLAKMTIGLVMLFVAIFGVLL